MHPGKKFYLFRKLVKNAKWWSKSNLPLSYSPDSKFFFSKPFLKRKIVRSGEWEKGEIDFDHHFTFLTNFLKRYNFLLSGILSGSSRGSFSIFLSKTDLPSDFVELGSEILYLFLAEKMVVCCLFVLFVATLSEFGLLILKLKHSSSWERCF